MIRLATQILLGLMLLFGTATLFPKAALCMKFGKKGRGALYIFLGVLSTVFAVMSFGYALTVAAEIF